MEVFHLERTLTQIDYLRLTRLLVRDQGGSDDLERLLSSSDLVAPTGVEPDIVTMYSQLLLADAESAAPFKLTLCYPDDADPPRGFVSVLSPVGLSLLGLRVGAVAHWQTPRGPRSATVLEILFQPEASGDYTT